MDQVIRCSSCGAPLQYQTDTPEKCTFCGSRLYFSPENRQPIPTGDPAKKVRPIIIGVAAFMVLISGMIGFFTFKGGVEPIDSITKNIADTNGTDAKESNFAKEIKRFGGEGTGAGKFTDNRVVGLDGKGNIYSSDYEGGRVQVFNSEGKFLSQWFNDLKYVQDFDVSRNGIVYICSGFKITSFDGSTGKKLFETESAYSGMDVLLDGSIIATTNVGDVWKLNADLKKQKHYKGAIEKANMLANSVSAIASNGLGEIFMLDMMGQNVYHFSSQLVFLDKFKTDVMSANDIEIDAQNNIYVSATNEVFVYNSDGHFQHKFPTTQTFGMAFDDDGNLWTASRPYILQYKINK